MNEIEHPANQLDTVADCSTASRRSETPITDSTFLHKGLRNYKRQHTPLAAPHRPTVSSRNFGARMWNVFKCETQKLQLYGK